MFFMILTILPSTNVPIRIIVQTENRPGYTSDTVNYRIDPCQLDDGWSLGRFTAAASPGGYNGLRSIPAGGDRDRSHLQPVHDWARSGTRGIFAPKGEATVLGYLNRFIEAHRFLEQGAPVTLVAGNVPVGLSSSRMVADGLMVVGDAARQVDPLTGGGIINAMAAGKIAAMVAVEAVAAGDSTAAFLSRYEAGWQQAGGRKNQRNYRLRTKFSPEQRVDERFVRAFALAAGG
jgi:hypothetical protein